MMKNILFVVAIAACGNKGQTPVSNEGSGSGSATGPTDTRSEIEKRRDAACKTLGPKMTECAVADAKVALEQGQIKQKDYDEITKPEIKAKNSQEFVEKCEGASYSSRQVRVLEVCQKEETECEPLLSCLDNLNKK